jgi:4-hydroxy-4-methyl-2-oxoglutarate aldolase
MPTRIARPPNPISLSRKLLAGWAGVPTTIVSDVSRGRLLLDLRMRSLRPFAGARRLLGPAVTAWCEPGDIGAALYAVALAKAGDVIVIDAGGCLQSAVVGEHLCGAARRNGAAGMIVNGAVRDIGPIAAWPDFPVFTLGNTARGPVSIERGTVGAAIVCGGIRVEPHDLILADDDGVIAIPRAEAVSWLEAAQAKLRVEEEWDRRLSAGETTLQVFAPPA